MEFKRLENEEDNIISNERDTKRETDQKQEMEFKRVENNEEDSILQTNETINEESQRNAFGKIKILSIIGDKYFNLLIFLLWLIKIMGFVFGILYLIFKIYPELRL
jgi:hypothetical protein